MILKYYSDLECLAERYAQILRMPEREMLGQLQADTFTSKDPAYQSLNRALECNHLHICEAGADYAYRQQFLNVRERAFWIALEIGVVRNQLSIDERRDLAAYRKLFLPDENDRIPAESLVYEFSYGQKVRSLAVICYLEMHTAWKMSLRRQDSLASFRRDLTKHLFQLEDALSTRYIHPHSNNWLSALLRRFTQDISTLLSAANSSEASLQRISECFKHYEALFLFDGNTELGEKCSVSVYSSELELPVPLHVVRSMLNISNNRVIDRKERRKQQGFGGKVLPLTIEDCLKRVGSYLIVIEVQGVPTGFYLLQTESSAFPESVQAIEAILEEKGEMPRENIGWVDYVVMSAEDSRALRRIGISGYGLSCYVSSFIADFHQLQFLFGTCRSGVYANTAIRSHLQHGWKDTGIEVPAKIFGDLSQDPAIVIKYDLNSLTRARWYEDGNRRDRMLESKYLGL